VGFGFAFHARIVCILVWLQSSTVLLWSDVDVDSVVFRAGRTTNSIDSADIRLAIWIVSHLWADLDRDRRVGGSRPNQNDYVFVILVTYPKSYIETTDRCNFGGKP